ncbi:MAG: hypothetical protein ABJB05_04860 [Parafilimonas sp.]
MQLQVDIEFDQLVEMVKRLPAKQWTKLKAEDETPPATNTEREKFKKILLAGHTFSKKQLQAITETRKAINKWRTK